jgi:hypothetical protein
VLLAAPREQPLAVDRAVLVVVPDRHHDPALADLVLGPAVDLAAGGVGTEQLDAVTDDLVHGAVEPSELGRDERPKRVSAATVPPELYVRDEQRDPRLHVAVVHGERVAHRELLDPGPGLEPRDPLLQSARHTHAPPVSIRVWPVR